MRVVGESEGEGYGVRVVRVMGGRGLRGVVDLDVFDTGIVGLDLAHGLGHVPDVPDEDGSVLSTT